MDFGGGIGTHSIAAAALPKVDHVFFVDLNPFNRDFVRERAKKLGISELISVHKDLESIGNIKFDTVICFDVLEHLPNPSAQICDIKKRMSDYGRSLDSLKVLPGAFIVVGQTKDEAIEKKRALDDLVHPDSGMATLSVLLGCDVSSFDPDGPLPHIPPSNASKSGRVKLIEMAKRENMTVAQLAKYVGGSFSILEIIGTPRQIADEMESWFDSGACDGFNIMFPFLPQGLDDFVDLVVPELQERGIYRSEYRGETLREHLGLEKPQNQFFN